MQGLPAGETVDSVELAAFLARRKPGTSPLSSARQETDEPIFLSGLTNGSTNGAPLCAMIENRDARSGDYESILDTPRPRTRRPCRLFQMERQSGTARRRALFRQADRAALHRGRHRKADVRRAGNIFIGAHLKSVAGITDEPFPLFPDRALFEAIAKKPFPVLSDASGERMQEAILAAGAEGDSVGRRDRVRGRRSASGAWRTDVRRHGEPAFRRAVRHSRRQGRGVWRGVRFRAAQRLYKTTTRMRWRRTAVLR